MLQLGLLQGSHGSSVLLYYRLGVGGKKTPRLMCFLSKKGVERDESMKICGTNKEKC